MPPSPQASRRALSAQARPPFLFQHAHDLSRYHLGPSTVGVVDRDEIEWPKRTRRASLETFTKRAQRAAQSIGRAVTAIEEKADGTRVARFGTPAEQDEITITTVPDCSEWH